MRSDARKRLEQASDNAAPESFTVADIEKAYENHASPDDWGVPAFYLGGLLSALRGEYDVPNRSAS